MTPGESRLLSFGAFTLDLRNQRLWGGSREIALSNKAFSVLTYLIDHADQLVTRNELFNAVWPEVVVGDAALFVCISEIRKALQDERQTPKFIETVHGRGYRFVASVAADATPVLRSKFGNSVRNTQPSAPLLVGRESELVQLHSWWRKALNGARQIVFISGEPGIGKTTLMEAFLEQVVSQDSGRIGRGQCIEHYGPGEAYLPVLEALGRLCRPPEGQSLRQSITSRKA